MAEVPVCNPWHQLRARPHLTLVWAELHAASGVLVDHGDGRRSVVLDPTLGRRARKATLAHELVHDERNLPYDRTTPPALIAKEEAAVRAETARRLVPPAQLDRVAGSGEPVELWELADRFDVPEDVARTAVERWVLDRARRRP